MANETMTLISTVTTGSSVASINFTGIPQTATDLCAILSVRGGTSNVVTMRINGLSANYSDVRLSGTGTTTATTTNYVTDQTPVGYSGSSGDAANVFGNATVYIPNYSGSLTKLFISESSWDSNASANYMGLIGSSNTSTSAITSITFYNYGSTIDTYSTISLYSITKGTGGGTLA